MTAKEYLLQISEIDTKVNNKIIEREQLLQKALCVTAQLSGDRVQSSGNPQKMAVVIEAAADIDLQIESLLARRQKIIATIERLDVVSYDILHMRYVQHFDFDLIADKRRCSYSNITTLHGRALAKLQRLIDATENF